jgi:hypothetical protein
VIIVYNRRGVTILLTNESQQVTENTFRILKRHSHTHQHIYTKHCSARLKLNNSFAISTTNYFDQFHISSSLNFLHNHKSLSSFLIISGSWITELTLYCFIPSSSTFLVYCNGVFSHSSVSCDLFLMILQMIAS